MIGKSNLRRLLALLMVFGLVAAACSSSSDVAASNDDEPAAEVDEADNDESDDDGAESDDDGAESDDDGVVEANAVACPHEGNTVFLFGPYEANESAGVNWRAGVDHGIRDINADGGILGCQIEIEWQDTQADADISKQVVANGVELEPYAIFGTVFSGSTIVNMVEAQRAGIPQIVGSEAATITDRSINGDNDFIFRTSFGGDNSAPKLAQILLDAGVTSVDTIYKNDEFGISGFEAHQEVFEAVGITINSEIIVQPQQQDLAAEVAQLAGLDGDAVFTSLSEIETGALHSEVAIQGFDKQLYGSDPLTAGGSISLANNPADANGAISHSGVVPGAEVFAEWTEAHDELFPELSESRDHNNIKGYLGVHVLKEITERLGAFDQASFGDELRCATITTDDEPGVLLDVTYDGNGDLDRDSFIVEVVDGVGIATGTVGPLGNLADRGCPGQ